MRTLLFSIALSLSINSVLHAQLHRFVNDYKVGYKDASGTLVIRAKYDAGSDFKEGFAVIIRDSKRGYINTKGEEVITPQYDDASLFDGGLACVASGGKWGFINTEGIWVIQPVFDNAFSFSEGTARILRNGKWGMINQHGTFIVPPIYKQLFDLTDGLIAATLDGVHYGYLDARGKMSIEPRFRMAMPFEKNSHRAIVITSEGQYYINKRGGVVAKVENSEGEEKEEQEREGRR